MPNSPLKKSVLVVSRGALVGSEGLRIRSQTTEVKVTVFFRSLLKQK